MSTSDSCTASSIISRNVIITYGVIYGLLLVVVSIYSYKSLNKDPKFGDKSFFKKCKGWILDLKKRKSCDIPLIAHLFDQATDISVAIQFYELGTTKSADNWSACNGLNIWYLFILTIMSLIIYRVITGYLIYNYTNKSWTRLISQILDVELLRSLYINYLCGKSEPCDPQRWITAMEAVLESTPQSLIQLVYLVKTGAFNANNILFLVSLLSSLWSIISKLISDDKAIIVDDAKNLNVKMKCHVFTDIVLGLLSMILWAIVIIICCPCIVCLGMYSMLNYEGGYENKDNLYDYGAFEMFNDLVGYLRIKAFSDQWKSTRSFSWLYIFRVIWRILDVTSRLFSMVLIWLIIGGLSLGIIIGFEFISFIVLCIKTKHWELIFGCIIDARFVDDIRYISHPCTDQLVYKQRRKEYQQ